MGGISRAGDNIFNSDWFREQADHIVGGIRDSSRVPEGHPLPRPVRLTDEQYARRKQHPEHVEFIFEDPVEERGRARLLMIHPRDAEKRNAPQDLQDISDHRVIAYPDGTWEHTGSAPFPGGVDYGEGSRGPREAFEHLKRYYGDGDYDTSKWYLRKFPSRKNWDEPYEVEESEIPKSTYEGPGEGSRGIIPQELQDAHNDLVSEGFVHGDTGTRSLYDDNPSGTFYSSVRWRHPEKASYLEPDGRVYEPTYSISYHPDAPENERWKLFTGNLPWAAEGWNESRGVPPNSVHRTHQQALQRYRELRGLSSS